MLPGSFAHADPVLAVGQAHPGARDGWTSSVTPGLGVVVEWETGEKIQTEMLHTFRWFFLGCVHLQGGLWPLPKGPQRPFHALCQGWPNGLPETLAGVVMPSQMGWLDRGHSPRVLRPQRISHQT